MWIDLDATWPPSYGETVRVLLGNLVFGALLVKCVMALNWVAYRSDAQYSNWVLLYFVAGSFFDLANRAFEHVRWRGRSAHLPEGTLQRVLELRRRQGFSYSRLKEAAKAEQRLLRLEANLKPNVANRVAYLVTCGRIRSAR